MTSGYSTKYAKAKTNTTFNDCPSAFEIVWTDEAIHPSFSSDAILFDLKFIRVYQLLIVMGALKQGESVLIHNAGGGVGLAALDIAKHVGAVTFGTASSRKHAFLKERGLDHAIDYRTQDLLKEIEELTEGRGVELVDNRPDRRQEYLEELQSAAQNRPAGIVRHINGNPNQIQCEI